MKSIAANVAKQNAKKESSTWLDKLAKKQLISLFENLTVGHLTIEDGGEIKHFGQNAKDTDIVANIYVNDLSAYRRVLLGGSIGSGEAYIEKLWWSPDLVQVIRIFVANMSLLEKMDSRWSRLSGWLNDWLLKRQANTKDGSRRNISAHYDLSNDFFELFLDKTMQYSSAVYENENDSLEQASETKLRKVCEQLKLSQDDHLLEIGTGWGGLATYAAKNYGCQVTTVTISKRQFEYASARVEREGLTDLVDVRLQDYRDVKGKYSKLVSIEMIEAVGYQFYKTYFNKCSDLLTEDGLMLIQAITIPDQRYEMAKKSADFIKKYIFPGGCLPSVEAISTNLRKFTDMQIVSLSDITLDYAKTLKEWRVRFFHNIDSVKQQGFSEEFTRMWDFYLSYCEGGFTERVIGTSQIVFAKPSCKQLPRH